MPNSIQKFARQFISQLKKVVPSTSPQSAPLSADPSIEEAKALSSDCVDLTGGNEELNKSE